MAPKIVSRSTLHRLPLYLNYLRSLSVDARTTISATAIAAALQLGEVQVRKDLASISVSGRPRIGYRISDLIEELMSFLGYADRNDAVIIGTGKLGRALLDYAGFGDYGLNIVAGFDVDPFLTERTDGRKAVFSMEQFPDLCRRMKIQLGILTVPAAVAQETCDLMVEHGIRAILNFTPVHLRVPETVLVQDVDIAAMLAVLSSRLLEYENGMKIKGDQKR